MDTQQELPLRFPVKRSELDLIPSVRLADGMIFSERRVIGHYVEVVWSVVDLHIDDSQTERDLKKALNRI